MRSRKITPLRLRAPGAARSRTADCPASARRSSPPAGRAPAARSPPRSAPGARARQRPNLHPGQQRILLELEQHRGGNLMVRQLGRTAGRDHQQPSGVEPPGEETQRLPRRGVGEMHIIKQHHQRSPPQDVAEQIGETLQQPGQRADLAPVPSRGSGQRDETRSPGHRAGHRTDRPPLRPAATEETDRSPRSTDQTWHSPRADTPPRPTQSRRDGAPAAPAPSGSCPPRARRRAERRGNFLPPPGSTRPPARRAPRAAQPARAATALPPTAAGPLCGPLHSRYFARTLR